MFGRWGYSSDFYSYWQGEIQQFNRTIPTSNPDKTIPNGPITTNYPWMGLKVSDPWYYNKPLTGVVDGCDGLCTAMVRAPAFAATECRTEILPVDYTIQRNWSAIWQGAWSAPPMNSYAYFTAPSMAITDDEEWLNVVTGFGTSEDCKGILNYTICTLKSAIGEYNVSINKDELTVQNPESPTIIALANNTAPNYTWVQELDGRPSTLSGIASLAINTWNSAVWIQREPSGNLVPEFIGGTAVMTLQTTNDVFCPSFKDPRPSVMSGLNRMMVYTGAFAARQYSENDLYTRLDDGK